MYLVSRWNKGYRIEGVWPLHRILVSQFSSKLYQRPSPSTPLPLWDYSRGRSYDANRNCQLYDYPSRNDYKVFNNLLMRTGLKSLDATSSAPSRSHQSGRASSFLYWHHFYAPGQTELRTGNHKVSVWCALWHLPPPHLVIWEKNPLEFLALPQPPDPHVVVVLGFSRSEAAAYRPLTASRYCRAPLGANRSELVQQLIYLISDKHWIWPISLKINLWFIFLLQRVLPICRCWVGPLEKLENLRVGPISPRFCRLFPFQYLDFLGDASQ